MDTAVALVQSYLYMNGYFTVTEYPVLELMADGEYRTVTDVDVLAVHIPGAGRDDAEVSGSFVSIDPDLGIETSQPEVPMNSHWRKAARALNDPKRKIRL